MGGASNGFTSQLTDNGVAQTLTITNGLTVGQTGYLYLTGGSTVSAGADSSNAGYIELDNASTLKVTGTLTNVGSIQLYGSTLSVTGNLENTVEGEIVAGASQINVTGTLTNHLGTIEIAGGPVNITGTLTNSGDITVGGGGSLNITGDVTNSGGLSTGIASGGSITISGRLTNTGVFSLMNGGDTGSIGELTNTFYVFVGGGATLNLTNQPNGITDIPAGSEFFIDGTFTAGGNSAFANLTSVEGTLVIGTLTNNQVLVLSGGSIEVGVGLVNNKTIDLEGASLTVDPFADVTNSGTISTGGSGGNTITIIETLNNNLGATFSLNRNGDVGNVGMLNNSGAVFVGAGATLNLTNQPNGITDVVAGSTWVIGGNFAVAGVANTGFANLTSVEGSVVLSNGQATNITLGGGVLTVSSGGSIDLEQGSTLTISGAPVVNSGTISTSLNGGSGGNTITINGTLTNGAEGTFQLNGPGDKATIGSLTNDPGGLVDVERGSTLTITGDVINSESAGISTNDDRSGGGNTLNINGTLTNNGFFSLKGPHDTATIGSLNNSANSSSAFVGVEDGSLLKVTGNLTNSAPGLVSVQSGSMLTVGGAVDNSGTLQTSGGMNTITVTGLLTNEASGQFTLNGAGDKATIGSVVNYSGPGLGIDLENGSSLTVNGNVANGDTQHGQIGEMGTSLNGGSGGNTLTITGTLTNSHLSDFGLLGPGDMATIGSVITEGGFFDVKNGSTLTVTGDVVTDGTQIETGGSGGNTLTINGTLTTHIDGGLILNGPKDTATIGSIVNSPDPSDLHLGLIDVENGSTLTVKGDVNNSGNMYTSFYKGSGGNTIEIDGTLTNSPGAVFSLLNPTDKLIINGGMNLFGGAALSTPTLNNGGTINVDNLSTLLVGLGVLHGPGYNYTQLANGTLGEIINSQGSYGTITVNGSALLGGTLDILLKQGFNPRVGSIFQFLFANPGQVGGTFGNIQNDCFNGGTECWLVTYDNTDGIVELTAEKAPVPEPATLLVLIPGLLGVGYGLRRKLVG